MLAPALRQDLLERLDALARPAGEVQQGPLLELVVDLFLAQSEVEEPERRRACLDLALSLVPRAAPEPLRAIASRPGLTEDIADAIVRRGDRDAVALLVANRSARLRPKASRRSRTSPGATPGFAAPSCSAPTCPERSSTSSGRRSIAASRRG